MPSKRKQPLRIKLSPEQVKAVRKATGKNADYLELSVEELEERIAPMRTIGHHSLPR